MNSEAGWKALTGTSSFQDIAKSEDDKMKLAFALFIDRIINYIGAYFIKLRGQVDAVVFSGGIGEESTDVWEAVCEACYDVVGIRFDKKVVESEGFQQGPVRAIGDGRVKTLVCKTNEEVSRRFARIFLSCFFDRHSRCFLFLAEHGPVMSFRYRAVQVPEVKKLSTDV